MGITAYAIAGSTLVFCLAFYYQRKVRKPANKNDDPTPTLRSSNTSDEYMCIDCGDRTIFSKGDLTVVAERRSNA